MDKIRSLSLFKEIRTTLFCQVIISVNNFNIPYINLGVYLLEQSAIIISRPFCPSLCVLNYIYHRLCLWNFLNLVFNKLPLFLLQKMYKEKIKDSQTKRIIWKLIYLFKTTRRKYKRKKLITPQKNRKPYVFDS